MAASFFRIAGNIKQRFLPFQLNPNSPLNDLTSTSYHANYRETLDNADGEQVSFSLNGVSPQFFTYKSFREGLTSGAARLGFYPSIAFPNEFLNMRWPTELGNDISYKLLYNQIDKNSLKISDIISSIPGISIREFLPDTRLDQCINFFKDFFQKISEIMLQAKDTAKDIKIEKDKMSLFFKKIWNCAVFTMMYMVGYDETISLANDFFNLDTNATLNEKIHNAFRYTNQDQNLIRYVKDFPYILYYCLQSCTTTNIYEVPALCEGKVVAQSDGKPGWGDGSDIMGSGGFRATGLLNKLPIVGELANMVLGNIGVNYMPWWNADTGSKVAAPEVNIKFDLFNDSIYNSIANFIFVNTIVPGNKWIQYNVFQHSSNLYDVKIEGLNRLFACAASFNVTYDGVLREPPNKFIDILCKQYLSKSIDENDFKAAIINNKLIKLPDVYHVEMSFKSLLPANFNNFLYTYSQNVNHLTTYSNHIYDSGAGALLGQVVGKYADRIKTVWQSDKSITDIMTDFLQPPKDSEPNNEPNNSWQWVEVMKAKKIDAINKEITDINNRLYGRYANVAGVGGASDPEKRKQLEDRLKKLIEEREKLTKE